MCLHLSCFPFPYIRDGKFKDGLLQQWPEACNNCSTQQCLSDITSNKLYKCANGLNFIKINDNITVGGLKISPADERNSVISSQTSSLHISRDNLDSVIPSENNSSGSDTTKLWEGDSVPKLPKNIRKRTFFVSSFKHIAIDILLQLKNDLGNNESIHENKNYKDIFGRCKYFVELLKAYNFLSNPSCLVKTYKCTPSKLTTSIIKQGNNVSYISRHKKLKYIYNLNSSKLVTIYPDAVSSLIFTLLDNAAKFAPHNSTIIISTEDTNDGIDFAIYSSGPEIYKKESKDIYKPGYRGEKASHLKGDGMGLFIAKFLANEHLKTEICHQQKKHDKEWFKTKFSVKIPDKAGVLF